MGWESALYTAARAAPNVDPVMLYGIAQRYPDESDAIDIARGTAGFAWAMDKRAYLEDLPASTARSVWNGKMTAAERRAVASIGYRLPDPVSMGGPLPAAGRFLVGLAKKPVEAAGEALEALNKSLRAVQRGIRAGLLLDIEGLETPQTLDLGLYLSPREWKRAWDEVEHGEQTFDPREIRKLNRRYGEEKVNLAKQLAGGATPEEIAQSIEDQDEKQEFLANLHDDQEIPEIVRLLDTSKLSFGRTVAMQAGLQDNPRLFNIVSGAGDAAVAMVLDPLLVAGKVTKVVRVARYAVRGADDVLRISRTPAGQRWLADVSGHVAESVAAREAAQQSDAIGRLVERYPLLGTVANDLVSEKLTTPDKLRDWMADGAGLTAILTGRVTGFSRHAPTMPVLTRAGQARLAAKGTLKRAVDFAADAPARISGAVSAEDVANLPLAARGPLKLVAGGGSLARRFTTLVPRATSFDPSSKEAVEFIQRTAAFSLSAKRTREIVDIWAHAPDVGAKRQIYKSMLAEMFQAAGLDDTPEAKAWADRFLTQLDNSITQRVYATDGVDQMLVNGKHVAAGVLEGQLTDMWGVPSFRALWAQSKRASATRSVMGAMNNDVFDRFMETAWKPGVLLRLGFPLRAGGEELVGAMLREGVTPFLRSRLAISATTPERTIFSRVATRPLGFLYDHLPQATQAKLLTPAALAGHWMGEQTRRSMSRVTGRLAGREYVTAAEEIWNLYPEAFADKVSAVVSKATLYMDDPISRYRAMSDGRKYRIARMVGTGGFKEYKNADPHFLDMWKNSLDELSHDKLGRAALEVVDKPRDEAVRAVADFIESPAFKESREKALRSRQLRDGRQVGIDATSREAAEDWANVVLDHADSILRTPEGHLLDDVVAGARTGKVPNKVKLGEIDDLSRPLAVKGEDLLPVSDSNSWIRDVTANGFYHMVGRPMDWMVRQPLFVHNYALAKKELDGVRRQMVKAAGDTTERKALAEIEAQIETLALERAIGKSMDAVDDGALRSQFSQVTRNLFPFWHAQEQFYKRWARTFVHSPEAFRKAQLTMMGLRHTGVLHTDDNGDDYFMYPAVGAVQNVLTTVAEKVTGQKVTLPAVPGLSGKVKYSTPGLDGFLPGAGPLVSMPLSGLARRFPELAPIEEGVLGERGAGRPYWEQVVPTTVIRLYRVVAESPDMKGQLASAMNGAIQYLEANGHGLSADATPEEVEAHLERVQNWSRIFLITRMIFGFAGPAAPEATFDPEDLNGEFRDLLASGLSIDRATEEFMRRHPDATPYTVFQSTPGAPTVLPITEQAFEFMDEHREFLATYPKAAAWFFPAPDPTDKISMQAYREQLGMQLRVRKSPREFLTDIKFAQAAAVYFESRDAKDLALEGARGPRADRIRHAWAIWKEGYFKSHPIFAQELTRPDRESVRRERIEALRGALNDERAPQTENTDRIRLLMDGFTTFEAEMLRLSGLRSGSAARRRARLRAGFSQWARQLVQGDAMLEPIYDRLMREDAEPDG